MKRLLWLSLVAMAALCAEAQRVDNLLQQFDVKRDVVSANAFFSQLKEEEFIDEAVVFSPKTPADSLQQQVWYWAAEWLYHQQQYERSVTYGQKALPLFDVRLNPDGRADCLNILALAYLRLTDFDTYGQMTNETIAEGLGYKSRSHFIRTFKKMTGLTPSQYQKIAREEQQ